jgi:AraC-like DNA-binding protein
MNEFRKPPHVLNFSHVRSRSMVQRDESHRHQWHELVMILSGEYHAECEGRRIASQPGTVLHYGSGQRHAWKTQEAEFIEYYLLQYDADSQAPHAQPFAARDHSGQLRSLLRRIEELRAATPRNDALIDSYLAVLLYEFHATADSAEGDFVSKVRSFIYSRLNRPIRLRDMARAGGLSPFHFSRAFKRKLGISPMQYVRKVRAEAALPLLKGTDLPHKAIAREVGLANERDLYRLFMAVFKKAPSDFRA